MSTHISKLALIKFAIVFSAASCISALASRTTAQEIKTRIQIEPATSRVIIEGSCAPRLEWSFRDNYGSLIGLGNRIEKFQLFEAAGSSIDVRRLAPGQFKSAKPGVRFKYEVNLAPPVMATDSALVSWLTNDRGLLMLADLLPLLSPDDEATSGSVRFEAPNAYSIFPQARDAGGVYQVSNLERAVFAVGRSLRITPAIESGFEFEFVTDGDWAFRDDEAVALVGQVLSAQRRVFNAMPGSRASMILFPFPETVGAGQWAAETRGENVTLLIGKLPSKVAALAQLGTPLTHELFHLWVPNALSLKGDYDWFYEGFTMYEAAQIAVRLNLLTFQEFLNAIGRANDAYLRDPARDRWSLIEASKRRWTSGATFVYSKSMIIALLIDLKMRESGNRRGLDTVYQQLFSKYRMSEGQSGDRRGFRDGNDAVLELLKNERGPSVIEPIAVDLNRELTPFGLVADNFGGRTRVIVADRMTKKQRDLLGELGYNAATHGPK